MKPIRMAILNARRLKAIFQWMKNSGMVLLMVFTMFTISCDKSDDIEPIEQDSPGDGELPADDDSIIVYTDLEPDFTGRNLIDCFELNLNNDQIVDFVICPGKEDDWEWLTIASNTRSGNGIISVAPWYSQALPLVKGQEIFKLAGYRNGEFYETISFIAIGYCFHLEENCSYDWANKAERFLGLKFDINGRKHYGWAQLEVKSATEWTIKDYAYNATPDKPILAGQTE